MLEFGGYVSVHQQHGLAVLVDIEQLRSQRVAAIVSLTFLCVEVNAHASNVAGRLPPTVAGRPVGVPASPPATVTTVVGMWRTAPERLVTDRLLLEPLGPEHNERDHRAWTSSIDHIRATPGFRPEHWDGDEWPYPMSSEQNLADLADHAREFATGVAFAYTVLDPTDGDVIGCVYVDPVDPGDPDEARCRSWVRADCAQLDEELHRAVRDWLTGPAWGLAAVRFPGRD